MVGPQPVLVHGVISPQVQNLALPPAEVPINPFLFPGYPCSSGCPPCCYQPLLIILYHMKVLKLIPINIPVYKLEFFFYMNSHNHKTEYHSFPPVGNTKGGLCSNFLKILTDSNNGNCFVLLC